MNPLKKEKDFEFLKEVLFAVPKRNKTNNKILNIAKETTKITKAIISQKLIHSQVANQRKDFMHTGNVSGLLLYAKADEAITPDNDYIMGGNRISVKTLDLGGTWEDIRNQLDCIAAVLIT